MAGERALPLSVVLVAYGMARELPRTLETLDPRRQDDIGADDYEVIVVDNGSPEPIDRGAYPDFSGNLRVLRVDDAPPSPAYAANLGVAAARGALVGLVVDAARMVSPGLLSTALLAARLADRPVITAPAWHLGPVAHMRAAEVGYDQAMEDQLLADTDWRHDGYALFGVSSFAGSSWRGIFGPMGESSSLFMAPERWRELGGLNERFDLPGGGLVNHDLYHRACSLPGVRLVELLGEGTFHQFHGGAATSRRFSGQEMRDDYRAIRGHAYRPPTNTPLYVGTVPEAALAHVEASARLAIDGFPKRSH